MIGQRPHPALGNSTGDRQMLEYTGAGDGARLMMLVLHDDVNREYAYGPAQALPLKSAPSPPALYDEERMVRSASASVSSRNGLLLIPLTVQLRC
jgi:hypothetical protein